LIAIGDGVWARRAQGELGRLGQRIVARKLYLAAALHPALGRETGAKSGCGGSIIIQAGLAPASFAPTYA